MNIEVVRKTFTDHSSIGSLYIDGRWQCYTLEDVDRQIQAAGFIEWNANLKIEKQTAIPYGTYELIINFSNRFNKEMPLLIGVPDFSGVRIHSGNTEEDTEGCILVGKFKNPNEINGSRDAFAELMKILKPACKKEKILITVRC